MGMCPRGAIGACYSPLCQQNSQDICGFLQNLTSWATDGLEEGEKSSLNGSGVLVNAPKRAGTTVTKVTISNTLRHHGLKSCGAPNVPLLQPTHVQVHLKFATEHLGGRGEHWENVVVR